MKQTRFNSLKKSSENIYSYIPAISFLFIALIIYFANAFPSLYGDEYGSLSESHNLLDNLHAIGYFFQLHLWSSISHSDWFLRILSLCWFGIGVFWFNNWLRIENLQQSTRRLIVWLTILSPFLWIYGFQIRFYAMFFATSILFVWRFRVWQQNSSSLNLLFLLVGGLLLITSHLFGFLVLVTTLINYIWAKLGKKRWVLLVTLVLLTFIIFIPFIRSFLVSIVFRMTNNYANIPNEAGIRGISLAMLAKIPLTLFFFTLGERVYPLWLWVVIPAMLSVGIASFFGVWRLRHLGELGSLIVFMLLNIPIMYLILDPIAPPGLQGAAPRYLIYVIPYFLMIIAIGAQRWKPLKYIVIMVSMVGLFLLVKPAWSSDSSNLVNWPKLLQNNILSPDNTCVVTDGRANDPVVRYVPVGTKVVNWDAKDCLGYSRVILITNDFRLSKVRKFDQISENLSTDYIMVSNQTFFPEQITVFDKSTESGQFLIMPGRLDLPEEDLRFPLVVQNYNWTIPGFVRLDNETPSMTFQIQNKQKGNFWILTNYLDTKSIAKGTPVFSLDLKMKSGESTTMFLRSGKETANWKGICGQCSSIYRWIKKISLVGSYSYPGAYQQYTANIWGFPININLENVSSIEIKYLLSDGTGYYYGIYPRE